MAQLMGSTVRVRLLSLFLRYPTRSFYGSELAFLVNARVWGVQRELRRFEQLRLVTKSGGRYRVFYRLNRKWPLVPELRALVVKAARRPKP